MTTVKITAGTVENRSVVPQDERSICRHIQTMEYVSGGVWCMRFRGIPRLEQVAERGLPVPIHVDAAFRRDQRDMGRLLSELVATGGVELPLVCAHGTREGSRAALDTVISNEKLSPSGLARFDLAFEAIVEPHISS